MRSSRSAWLAGHAAPIGAIRSSVPRDDGGRFDDRERRGPLRPYGPQCDPEEAVSRIQSRTTTVSQGGELLSQREMLEDGGVSRSDEGATGPDNELTEQTHRGNMRPARSACKRTRAQTIFSSTVRRTE